MEPATALHFGRAGRLQAAQVVRDDPVAVGFEEAASAVVGNAHVGLGGPCSSRTANLSVPASIAAMACASVKCLSVPVALSLPPTVAMLHLGHV